MTIGKNIGGQRYRPVHQHFGREKPAFYLRRYIGNDDSFTPVWVQHVDRFGETRMKGRSGNQRMKISYRLPPMELFDVACTSSRHSTDIDSAFSGAGKTSFPRAPETLIFAPFERDFMTLPFGKLLTPLRQHFTATRDHKGDISYNFLIRMKLNLRVIFR
jgi:hypothetical protein